MDIQEFNQELKAEVLRLLPFCCATVHKALGFGADPGIVPERLVDEPATVLAEYGFLQASEVSARNRLALAVFRNRQLDAFMATFTMALFKRRPEIASLLGKATIRPDLLTTNELDTLITWLLEDDSLITRPMEIMAEDPDIRLALSDIGFQLPGSSALVREQFKALIQTCSTYSDLINVLNNRSDPAPLGVVTPLATTLVAVVVLISVAAAVQTVAIVWAWVFCGVVVDTCTSAQGVPASTVEQLTVWQGSCRSLVINESDYFVWVSFRSPAGGPKRVPLAPGQDTAALAIESPEAVLTGDTPDEVQVLRLPNDMLLVHGGYLLNQDIADPGVAIITSEAQNTARVVVNEAQSQLANNCQITSEQLSTSTIAALYPKHFDIERARCNLRRMNHYYTTRRILNYFDGACKRNVQ